MTESGDNGGCQNSISRQVQLAVAVPVLACAAPGGAAARIPLNYLVSSGERADNILPLTWGVLAISIIVIIIIAGLLLWAILRKRDGPRRRTFENTPVERGGNGLRWIGWGVGLSSIVLFATVILTIQTLARVMEPDTEPALSLEITAHQWWWSIRYKGDIPSESFVTANEIHIPVGEPVRIRLKGADVIHSFWVPALTGKTDVIPGRTNVTWMTAGRPGIYRGQCSEYCGAQHAKMGFLVVAQPRDEFEDWRREQLQPAEPPEEPVARRGRQRFLARCSGCHAVRGTGAGGRTGPDLTHLMSRRTLGAATMENTPEKLARWVTHAQDVKPGNHMPDIDMGRDELAALTAYLQTLE